LVYFWSIYILGPIVVEIATLLIYCPLAAAGLAFIIASEELIPKIEKENWFDYDVIVATPDMMGVVGRLGKVLGPKGLICLF